MSVPTELHYTADHEWVAVEGDVATVGITAFAGEALGDVVYVDLPAVGTAITTGDACGEIESTKSVSDLFAPVDGEVVELNEAVVADPGLLNTDPYQAGWLIRIKVTGPTNLMAAGAYEALIGGE
jgi:glycine cleavage system H protein